MTPTGDRLALLSHRALLRAAAVAGCGAPAPALQALLYRAGSVALGPRQRRTHDERWLAFLTEDSARGVPGLDAGWASHRSPHWRAWSRADADRSGLCHKTYVSPLPHAFAAALPVVLRVAVELGVPSLKVGCTPEGVLRPDKIVLYAGSPAAADALARVLTVRLAGLPAQGVPFSAQVDGAGLVSRGTDPPGTSWRAHVTALAADALHELAVPGGRAADLVEAVRDVLAGQGLDGRSWQPVAA
jgi:hypothetical protein